MISIVECCSFFVITFFDVVAHSVALSYYLLECVKQHMKRLQITTEKFNANEVLDTLF